MDPEDQDLTELEKAQEERRAKGSFGDRVTATPHANQRPPATVEPPAPAPQPQVAGGVRRALEATSEDDAGAQGTINRLATLTGRNPAELRALSRNEIDRLAREEGILAATQDAPKLRERYTDDDFARVAKDDVAALAEIEKQMAAARGLAAKDNAPRPQSMDEKLAAVFGQGFKPTLAGVNPTIQGNPAVLANPARATAAGAPDWIASGFKGLEWLGDTASEFLRSPDSPALDVLFGVSPEERAKKEAAGAYDKPKAKNPEGVVERFSAWNAGAAKAYNQLGDVIAPEATGDWATDTFNESLRSALPSIATSLGTVLTGNPELALPLMMGQDASNTYVDYKDAGIDYATASLGALAHGGVEGVTELLPFNELLGAWASKTPVAEAFWKVLRAEVPSESLAYLGQDIIDWAVKSPEQPFEERMKTWPEGLAKTFVATLMTVGLQSGIMKVARGMQEAYVRAAREKAMSEGGLKTLDAVVGAAVESKTRELDPQKFEEFVDSLAQDAPVKAAYISPEAFAMIAASEAKSPDELATEFGVDKQVSEAMLAGTPIEIPLGRFASVVAGKESTREAYMRSVSWSPFTLSRDEMKVRLSEETQRMMAESARLAEKVQSDSVFAAGVNEIHRNVKTQLDEARRFVGLPNDLYAKITATGYGVLAQRLGITPQEAFAQYPLRVEGQSITGTNVNADGFVEQNTTAATTDTEAGFAILDANNDTSTSDLAAQLGVTPRQASLVRKAWKEARGVPTLQRAGAKDVSQPGFDLLDANPNMRMADLSAQLGVSINQADKVRKAWKAARKADRINQRWEEYYGQDQTFSPIAESAANDLQDAAPETWADIIKATKYAAYRIPDRMEDAPLPKGYALVWHTSGAYAVSEKHIREREKAGQAIFTRVAQTRADHEKRGMYVPSKATIHLLSKADFSTYLHELGHHYLEFYTDIAARLEAKAMGGAELTPGEQGIVDDFTKWLTLHGIKPGSAPAGGPGSATQAFAQDSQWALNFFTNYLWNADDAQIQAKIRELLDNKQMKYKHLRLFKTSAGRIIAFPADYTHDQARGLLTDERFPDAALKMKHGQIVFGQKLSNVDWYDTSGELADEGDYSQLMPRTAVTAPVFRLQEAEDMELEGRSAADIWRRTGWARTKAREWVWELPGQPQFKFNPERAIQVGTLDQMIDWPELFDAMPMLRGIYLYAATGNQSGTFFSATTVEMTDGTRKIAPVIRARGRVANSNELMETIRHEIQHAIQIYGGFASTGALSNDIGEYRGTELFEKAKAEYRAMERRFLEEQGLEPTEDNMSPELTAETSAAMVVYLRNHGEWQARDVEWRSRMSDDWKQNNPPGTEVPGTTETVTEAQTWLTLDELKLSRVSAPKAEDATPAASLNRAIAREAVYPVREAKRAPVEASDRDIERASKEMSERDFEVYKGLVAGLTNTEIADQLNENIDDENAWYDSVKIANAVHTVIANAEKMGIAAPNASRRGAAVSDATLHIIALSARGVGPKEIASIVYPDRDADKASAQVRVLRNRYKDTIEQIKNKNAGSYGQDPIFYSALTRALENAKQEKASAEEWKAIIRRTEGVKVDEIEAVGLFDWLDVMATGAEKRIPKSALVEFAKSNGVRIEIVSFGPPQPKPVVAAPAVTDQPPALTNDSARQVLAGLGLPEPEAGISDDAIHALIPHLAEESSRIEDNYQALVRDLIRDDESVRDEFIDSYRPARALLERYEDDVRDAIENEVRDEYYSNGYFYDGDYNVAHVDSREWAEDDDVEPGEDNLVWDVLIDGETLRTFSTEDRAESYAQDINDENEREAADEYVRESDTVADRILQAVLDDDSFRDDLEELFEDAMSDLFRRYSRLTRAAEVAAVSGFADELLAVYPDAGETDYPVQWYRDLGTARRGRPAVPVRPVEPTYPRAKWETYTLTKDGVYREFVLRLASHKGRPYDTQRSRTHFSGVQNALAFGRFRIVGDTLVLEEAQSDWHQEGRDKKYESEVRTPEFAAALEAARERMVTAKEDNIAAQDNANRVFADIVTRLNAADFAPAMQSISRAGDFEYMMARPDRLNSTYTYYRQVVAGTVDQLTHDVVAGATLSPELKAEVANMKRDVDAAMARASAAHNLSASADAAFVAMDTSSFNAIPDAPFKDSTAWGRLLMRYVIRYAAESGLKRVAWAPGDVLAERWSMYRVVDQLSVAPVPNSDTLVSLVGGKSGREVFNKTVSQAELDDFVGKKLGDMLRAAEPDASDIRSIDVPDDTMVGPGKGMTFFYDTALVNETNRMLKKYGGKVGRREFKHPETKRVEGAKSLVEGDRYRTYYHHFDLPEQLAADVMTGVPLFQDRDTDGNAPDIGGAYREAGPEATALQVWQAMTLEQKRHWHELFARQTEAYFFEGNAPTPGLRGLFSHFARWLRDVYKGQLELNAPLTNEVRDIMNRMYASEIDISEAQNVHNMRPLFMTQPPGMTDLEWHAYQSDLSNAVDEAQHDLESRSLRDMKWLGNARGRELKKLQAEAKEQRKAVRSEVAAEVMAEPVNRARDFLSRGHNPDGSKVESFVPVWHNGELHSGAPKLNISALKAMYPESSGIDFTKLGYGKYGMLAENGMHPDVLADLFGYADGDLLVRDLLSAEKAADKIEGLTNQRMMERHGDLSNEQSVQRAADEAVHSGLRARVLAAEYAALTAALGEKKRLNEAAKDAAEKLVARMNAYKLSPAKFEAAARKAGRAAEAALRKDDLAQAAIAKRDQLLNFNIVREIYKQQKERDKARALFIKIARAKKENVAKTRNFDLVQAARAILASVGMAQMRNKPMDYMDAVKRYDPRLYANLEPQILAALTANKRAEDMTVSEFLTLRDTVSQLWNLAREDKQIEIDGEKLAVKDVADQINQRLEDMGADPHASIREAPSAWQRGLRIGEGMYAALRRVEAWARYMDGNSVGVFTRFIFRPISKAADRYRADRLKYVTAFRDLLKPIEATLDSARIDAHEIGYSFRGKAEMLHAILHTGNESNMRKLLLGRKWGSENPDGTLNTTRWDTFVARMVHEGKITAQDYEFAQGVWDLLEQIKPLAQETHRRVFGRYFNEITAKEVKTQFGAYRGGYVPAIYDDYFSTSVQMRNEQELLDGSDSSMFPSPAKGFTESRVEYNDVMQLDLRLLSSHLDRVLKFAHMAAPVRDVLRILNVKSVDRNLADVHPSARADMLIPWLVRSARQTTEFPMGGSAGRAVSWFVGTLRRRASMGLMFANLVNVLQQPTGLLNAMAYKGFHKRYLAAALARYVRNPVALHGFVQQASPLMASRATDQAVAMRDTANQIIEAKGAFEKTAAWFERHTYFLQQALQNQQDVVVWLAAYESAKRRNVTEDQARDFADAVIRQTQGSNNPEDVSRFETGTGWQKVLTAMYGYFNMWGNQLSTEFRSEVREHGLKKSAGRLVYLYFAGFMIPALLAQAIADAMRGDLPDDDDDDLSLAWLAWFFGTQVKTAAAMAPGVGTLGMAAVNAFNNKPYDDRVLSSPAVSALETAARVPLDIWDYATGDGDLSRTTKDSLGLITLLTGIPAQALARPLGYVADIAEGDKDAPDNAVDAARGLVTGR